MDDDRSPAALAAALEDGSLDARSFPHAAHLAVALHYVRSYGADEGGRRMAAALRAYVAAQGAARVYHETLTRAWIELVASADAASPGCAGIEELLRIHPQLADVALPTRHYSPGLLHSEEARARFVAPDREPFARPLETAAAPAPALGADDGWPATVPDGPVVVAAARGGRTCAAVASAFAVLDDDPLVVGLAIAAASPLARLIHETHGFAVSLLDADDEALRLAQRIDDPAAWSGPHPLLGVPRVPAASGHPVLAGARGFADCRLEHGYTALPRAILLASCGDRGGAAVARSGQASARATSGAGTSAKRARIAK